MIVFTVDIDWAPDEVIEDTLRLFDENGVPVTVFATHRTRLLTGRARKGIEVGLHPNFNPLLEGKDRGGPGQILENMMDIYPRAVGVRSHSRTVSAPLVQEFVRQGLLYDANQICPYQSNLAPYNYCGFIRFTDFFQDDVHAMLKKRFEMETLPLGGEGLKIFCFHPVHVYLNTERSARYEKSKGGYKDAKMLRGFRNNTRVPGARDLLKQLLQHARQARESPQTLKRLAGICGKDGHL